MFVDSRHHVRLNIINCSEISRKIRHSARYFSADVLVYLMSIVLIILGEEVEGSEFKG